MAHGLEHAGQRVAEDGAAQVADVHLLGDVGRGVVDRDRLGLRHRGDAEARVGGHLADGAGEEAGVERQVDEAGPGDLHGRGDAREVEALHDLGGDVAGRAAELLAQAERDVGLVVGAIGAAQRRVRARVIRPERGSDRRLERRRQRVERVSHARSVPALPRAVKAILRRAAGWERPPRAPASSVSPWASPPACRWRRARCCPPRDPTRARGPSRGRRACRRDRRRSRGSRASPRPRGRRGSGRRPR